MPEKDIYKECLDAVTENINAPDISNDTKASKIMGLIHGLIKIFLVLANEDSMLLYCELRHIDDSIIKAKYN